VTPPQDSVAGTLAGGIVLTVVLVLVLRFLVPLTGG